MASRDLTYTIGVDASDAASGLRKLETAVRTTMRTVDDEMTEGASAGERFAATVDQVAGQMREDFASAATAAEELKRALKDAGANIDVGDAMTSLSRMGISMDEISTNADQLATSLKQLDETRVQGVSDLDSIAPGLATKLDQVGKSADSSKSALANMIGNTSQTMGELAGVSGDLGVGIGQIGEYMADAALDAENFGSVLSSFGKVVGPMAALAAATAVVSSVMSARARASEAEAQQVETLTDAYTSGVDPAQAYADALRDVGEVVVGLNRNAKTSEQGGIIGWIGGLSESLGPLGGALQIAADKLGVWGEATGDIAPLLAQAGVSVDQWTAAVMGGQQAYGTFATALSKTTLSADEQAAVLSGLADSQTANAEATKNASDFTTVFGDAAKEAAPSAEELAQATREAQQAADEHARAVTTATSAIDDLSSAEAEAERNATALTDAFADSSATADWASGVRDIEEGIAGLAEAADGIGLSDALDPTNLNADKLLDALDGLRGPIQDKIKTAFTEGGAPAAQAAGDQYVQQIVDALGGKLSPDKVKELLGIGDLSTILSVAVEQSALDRAKAEIDALVGVGGETPFTAYLKLAVQEGSLSAAAAHVLATWALQEQGVPVALDPQTDPAAIDEANAFISSYAASHPAVQPIEGDPTGATGAVDDAAKHAEGTTGVMPIDGDNKPATGKVDDVEDMAARTKPIIDIGADIAQAKLTMAIINIIAWAMSPTVRVGADISPALAGLATVQSQRPQVPVTAYLADYPTSSEIVSRIGRPRVPVDIVVGQSIRITGVRE